MITTMPNYGDVLEVEDEISGLPVRGTIVLIEEDTDFKGLYYVYLQSEDTKENIYMDKGEPYFRMHAFSLI